jgi:Tn3 transposase DDE domain
MAGASLTIVGGSLGAGTVAGEVVVNLVVAAIVLWNTAYVERATRHLRAGGEKIPSELMPYLAPLAWQHINLTGDYIWTEPSRLEGEGFRPLHGVVELDPHRCSRSVRCVVFCPFYVVTPVHHAR